ncbi:MAG: DUF1573 domain-containing protein [Lentimicrobium sp.]|nr:DUF1573 domain-containing protein [Lentimicrobium sp.]
MKRIRLKYASLVLIFFLALGLSSCRERSSGSDALSGDIVKNPHSADGMENTRMPFIEFEQDFHDFGKLIQGEKVSYAFKFTNTGKTDLIISKVSSSCGCTVPDYPKTPIRPGDTKKIDVKFDTENRRGFQNKTVTIVSNAQPSAKVLRIKAQIVLPEEQ